MSRRRYNRRRHNKNKELGCIVEMIFVPIALILALITSKDPAKLLEELIKDLEKRETIIGKNLTDKEISELTKKEKSRE